MEYLELPDGTTSYLHMLYDKNTLWDINNIPKTYEVEILQEINENFDKNFDDIINMNKIYCNICNLNIPKLYVKQHKKSSIHQNLIKLTDEVLKRTRKHLNTNDELNDTSLNLTETFFCDICSRIVQNNDRNEHLESDFHVKQVYFEKLLSSFVEAYLKVNEEDIQLNLEDLKGYTDKNEPNLIKSTLNQENVSKDPSQIQNTLDPKGSKDITKEDPVINIFHPDYLKELLESGGILPYSSGPQNCNIVETRKYESLQKSMEYKMDPTTGAKNNQSEHSNSQHILNTMNPNFHQINPMNPNVHQMNPNVHQIYSINPNVHQINSMNPNVHQMNPNVHQMNPNVHQINPNVHQINPDVQQMNPNLNPMNNNWNPINPNFNPMYSAWNSMNLNFNAMNPNSNPGSPHFNSMNTNSNFMHPNFNQINTTNPNFNSINPNSHQMLGPNLYINKPNSNPVNPHLSSISPHLNPIDPRNNLGPNLNPIDPQNKIGSILNPMEPQIKLGSNLNTTEPHFNLGPNLNPVEPQVKLGANLNTQIKWGPNLKPIEPKLKLGPNLNPIEPQIKLVSNLNTVDPQLKWGPNLSPIEPHKLGNNQNTTDPEPTAKEAKKIIKAIEKAERKRERQIKNIQAFKEYSTYIQTLQDKHSKEGFKIEAVTVSKIKITALNGDCVLVSRANFEGKSKTYCRVCQNGNLSKDHEFSEEHISKIMVPVADRNCIREIDDIWSHCIICDELIKFVEEHIKTGFHLTNLTKCFINIPKEKEEIDQKCIVSEEEVITIVNTEKELNDQEIAEPNEEESRCVVDIERKVDTQEKKVSYKFDIDKFSNTLADKLFPLFVQYALTKADNTESNDNNSDRDLVSEHLDTVVSNLQDNKNKVKQLKESIQNVVDKDSKSVKAEPKKIDDEVASNSSSTTKNTKCCNICKINVVDYDTHKTSDTHRAKELKKLITRNNLKDIKNNIDMLKCEICNVNVNKNTKQINEHVYSQNHRRNYFKLIESNKIILIDQVESQCEPCNKSIPRSNIFDHCKNTKHVKKLKDLINIASSQTKNQTQKESEAKQCIENKAVVQNDIDVTKILYQFRDQGVDYLCKICHALVAKDAASVKGHIETKKHVDIYYTLLRSNKIFKTIGSFHCEVCNAEIPMTGEITHVYGRNHIDNLALKAEVAKVESNVVKVESNGAKVETNIAIIESTVAKDESNGARVESNAATASRDIVGRSVTPVASSVTPVASSVTPVASSVTPVASSVTPVASSVTPVASSVTPVASSVTPVASSVTPVASSVTPVASSVTPVASSVTPVASSVTPVASTSNEIASSTEKETKLPLYVKYQYKNFNVIFPMCLICNKQVSSTEIISHVHLNTHIFNFNLIMINNTIKIQGNMYFCLSCNTHVPVFGEIQHIFGKTHLNNKKQQPIASKGTAMLTYDHVLSLTQGKRMVKF